MSTNTIIENSRNIQIECFPKLNFSLQQSNIPFINYTSQKAKQIVRKYNETFRNVKTEKDEQSYISDEATHMHPIFPTSNFPEISGYVENIIALTPTQHLNYAHPLGNTKIVDYTYQHNLLLAKISSIKENLTNQNVKKFMNFLKCCMFFV